MKKLRLTKKLTLNKQIISPLNEEQAARVLGGADAPTYGGACTLELCKTQVKDYAGNCITVDTYPTDNGCVTYPGRPCDNGETRWNYAFCFTDTFCTQGDCTDACPYTYGDISCNQFNQPNCA